METNKPSLEPFSDSESEEMWETIISRIRRQEEKKKKNTFIRFASVITAAALLILGGIFTYRSYMSPDIFEATNGKLTISLKDHSQVTLLQGAKLTIQKSFPSTTRDVYLEGNAIFQVSKSKEHPFIVHGKDYETRVLGTVFRISQIGKKFSVDLYEGKVQINKNGISENPVILHPKETFSNLGSPEIAVIMKTRNKNSSDQTDDKLIGIHFNECPLPTAIKTLELNYGIKIYYPLELKNENVSVAREDLNPIDVVKAIALQFNLNIKQINDSTFELEK